MRGAATEKARSPSFNLVRRVTRSLSLAERYEARPGTDAVVSISSLRYAGARPLMDRQTELEFNPPLNWQPMERSNGEI